MISAEGSPGAVLAKTARWHVGHGDATELTRELPDNSIDALVTDPPGGIEFMGKEWDKAARGPEVPLVVRLRSTLAALASRGGGEPDRRTLEREWFIWWLAGCLAEAYRVLKPGAHGLIWSIPRTTHWTGMAIEYAGFEIIDQVDHLFSQGASKSKSARRMLAMEECELPGRHCESALPPEASARRAITSAPSTRSRRSGTGTARDSRRATRAGTSSGNPSTARSPRTSGSGAPASSTSTAPAFPCTVKRSAAGRRTSS